MRAQALVEARGIDKHFAVRNPGLFGATVGTVRAVDNVNLHLFQGETLALVGESGCGKSTLARALALLVRPTRGEIIYSGESTDSLVGRRLRELRRDVQMIFQDPYSALDPRMTVAAIISEPLRIHEPRERGKHARKVAELMDAVGLSPSQADRYPHEFSGGQRQRIGIARALALDPMFIIADEPVSALDVSVQSQVLNLMQDLRENRRLTYLFITHDIAVVNHIADRVAVMYLGGIVECATRADFFEGPGHPYSQALLKAVPQLGRGKRSPGSSLGGEVLSPISPPSGCPFHPRCPRARDLCAETKPELEPFAGGGRDHLVACHFKD